MAVCVASGITSCEKGDDDDDWPDNGSSTSKPIYVDPASLTFDAQEHSEWVYVKNGGSDVSYIRGAGWITVYHSSGEGYRITVTSNDGPARESYVQFSQGSTSVRLTVYQSGSNGNNSGNDNNNSGNNNGGDNSGNTNTPQIPDAPTGLYASPSGSAAYPYAYLTWNASSGATSYTIYRSTSAYGTYSKVGTATYTSYSDESVKYGNTYYYKVTASNSKGTSSYSSYAECEFADTRTPGPVQYGNCSVSGTTMTLRWTVPTDASYGKPTKAILRVYEPTSRQYVDLETLSGTATSVSFNFYMWTDTEGYVRAGIILQNEYGTGGGIPKVYDTRNKKWVN